MDTKLTENVREIFPDEETFQRIYGECMENEPQASEKIRTGYRKMDEWFELYLCAVQEEMFRYAYQCGYEAGLRGGVCHV